MGGRIDLYADFGAVMRDFGRKYVIILWEKLFVLDTFYIFAYSVTYCVER